MTNLSRRMLLRGAVAAGVVPLVAGNRQEAHRFRTPDFDIEMTVEYHDGYTSRGFWFRERNSNRQFCLQADGEEGSQCLTAFRGSLALAQYRVRALSGVRAAPTMRELVRTIDRDERLRDRAPFERTIELKRGIGSDLQAFGHEGPGEEESMLRSHSPWYLFRQDLFLEQHKPFLAIFWKHAFPAIQVLDIIPGEQTWPATK